MFEEKLDKTLDEYVGDNLGAGCDCKSCLKNREDVRQFINDLVAEKVKDLVKICEEALPLLEWLETAESSGNDADLTRLIAAMKSAISKAKGGKE